MKQVPMNFTDRHHWHKLRIFLRCLGIKAAATHRNPLRVYIGNIEVLPFKVKTNE